jgi:hypothetical protein
MSTEVVVSALPDCDICKAVRGEQVAARYDGKTVHGPWAYMCEEHFDSHGVGLGTGRGQRLVVRSS